MSKSRGRVKISEKSAGIKFDSDKPDWSLLPLNAVEGVVKVMTFGARKYAPNNWKKIQDPERYRSALLRHMTAQQNGERIDPDSGLPHSAHIACNAIFLAWFDEAKIKSERKNP